MRHEQDREKREPGNGKCVRVCIQLWLGREWGREKAALPWKLTLIVDTGETLQIRFIIERRANSAISALDF